MNFVNYNDIFMKFNVPYMDAVFHAEANALMRAAEPNGGTLAGRTIEIRVDRPLCRSCGDILLAIGRQLGNPTARITACVSWPSRF